MSRCLNLFGLQYDKDMLCLQQAQNGGAGGVCVLGLGVGGGWGWLIIFLLSVLSSFFFSLSPGRRFHLTTLLSTELLTRL